MQFAFSLVENDREHRALRDELRLARRDIAMLQDQHQILVRDQKNLLGILERFGGGSALALGRDHVPTVRAKMPHVKRRRRTHPTGLLDRVCVALAVHYTTWPSVLG